jgi:hypothetical protein
MGLLLIFISSTKPAPLNIAKSQHASVMLTDIASTRDAKELG